MTPIDHFLSTREIRLLLKVKVNSIETLSI